MSASPRVPLLSLRQITLRFGAVEALVGVDLDVHAHQVVALVGDNGAGKSTLAKVISGVLAPDSGLIEIDGEERTIPSHSAAHALGIATVFQDLALCTNLDVTSNIFLGRELTDGALLDDGRMEQMARGILRDLTLRIPSVRTPLSELSAGQRQAVAIARTRLSNPKIVLMDEPTAAISVRQVAEVLNLIRRLKDQGMAVVLISHRIPDIFEVCDRLIVLRRGRKVGDKRVADSSPQEVTGLITGAIEQV